MSLLVRARRTSRVNWHNNRKLSLLLIILHQTLPFSTIIKILLPLFLCELTNTPILILPVNPRTRSVGHPGDWNWTIMIEVGWVPVCSEHLVAQKFFFMMPKGLNCLVTYVLSFAFIILISKFLCLWSQSWAFFPN